MLTKPPEEITVSEVVAVLEGGRTLINCDKNPENCDRVDECLTRYLWIEAAEAMFQRLSTITFADLLAIKKEGCKERFIDYLACEEPSKVKGS